MSDSNEEPIAVEQTASETSLQDGLGSTDYGYVSNGNTAGNVRLIKNYALFLFPKGRQHFRRADRRELDAAVQQEADRIQHRGRRRPASGAGRQHRLQGAQRRHRPVRHGPGLLDAQLAAMEGRKDVVSAYFDVDVESDGGISIKGAGLKKEWILVLVALDQQDRPFLLYGTNAKVSDRDDVSLKSSEIMNFSMTFKMLKGTNGEQFHAWGLVTEDAK